jgi:hypothetical protein
MASKNLSIDRQLSQGLSGQDKLRTLMKVRSGSVSRWAVDQGFIPEQVFMATAGVRPYPLIRDAIASDLDLDRAEVDRLIDESAERAA